MLGSNPVFEFLVAIRLLFTNVAQSGNQPVKVMQFHVRLVQSYCVRIAEDVALSGIDAP